MTILYCVLKGQWGYSEYLMGVLYEIVVSLVASDPITVNSHQHEFPNMRWKDDTMNM